MVSAEDDRPEDTRLLVSGRAIKPISKADFHFDRKVMSRSFIMKKLVSPTAVRSKEMPLKFRPGKLFPPADSTG